ncbi:MAG: histidine triad nucleotide-binding protein [Oligoflexales bacterium]|nr:histidine triad nucleotide-binding protein [Oligoflexales bacterium]
MSEVSIFDKIIAKEIPADIVYEDDWVLAFNDINPQAPVHVLVIPKAKIPGFSSLADQEAVQVGEFIKRISQVANKLGLDPDGYRVVFNQGKHGQQSVNYIHAHILGGKQLSWPPG